jgi:hypothetical protein
MRIRVLLIAIAFVAASAGANARSVSPQSGWSNLTTERLQQLPSSVRAAIVTAQKACGGDSIRVRNGFIRYLKDPNGDEFVTLHFDHFVATIGQLFAPRPDACIKYLSLETASLIAKSGATMFRKLI